MQQVYVLHYTVKILGIFFPLFLVIITIPYRKYLKQFVKEDRHQSYDKQTKIILIGDIVIFLLIFLFSSNMFINVYLKYKLYDYKQIEGKIENFCTSGGEESFFIKDIYFYYNSRQWEPGYSTVSADGGVFKGNGQYVRIHYIEHGNRNVIAAIWVEKTD